MSQHITFRLEIQGEEKTDVASMSLSQTMSGHHEFQIFLLTDYSGTNSSKFDKARKMIGATVLIEFESILEKSERSQFKGIITDVGISQTDSSTSQIVLQGFSPTILLDGLKNSAAFFEKSVSDVFNDVLKNQPSNLLGRANNSGQKSKFSYILQVNESDYNFLARQAQKLGEWFFYDGNQLNLGLPSSPKEHSLEIGGHISDVQIRMNTAPMMQSYAHFDYKTSKLNSRDVSADFKAKGMLKEAQNYSNKIFSSKARSFHPSAINDAGVEEELAKRSGASNAANLFVATGSTAHPGMKLGDVIEIKTSNESYGKFTIVSLSHQMGGSSEYFNSFSAISSDSDAPPVNRNIHQPIMYPAFAEVLQNNDPEKLGRVKVSFLWGNSEIETDWIRVVHSSAGNNYGNYFVPEIEDHVLVNFEYGNPDLPFVAGAAFHDKTTPAEFFDPKNHFKAILTRGENKIFISDEPGKERIEIINSKEKNRVVLDAGKKMIEIESLGDIKISGKNISLDAKEELSISCKTLKQKADKEASLDSMDVKINGSKAVTIVGTSKAEIKSTGKASLAGTASSEVQSGGIVQVKGSLVKIN